MWSASHTFYLVNTESRRCKKTEITSPKDQRYCPDDDGRTFLTSDEFTHCMHEKLDPFSHNSWSFSVCHKVPCFNSLHVQPCFDSVYDCYRDTVELTSPFHITSPPCCGWLMLQRLMSPHSQHRPAALILAGRMPWVKVTTHPHYRKRLG